MTDRPLPDERGVVRERPDLGGGAATPSFSLPRDAETGIPGPPRPVAIGPVTFDWGSRTYIMGILNVTPDSFSGDGLLEPQAPDRASDPDRDRDPMGEALARARRMVADGADILDVGGASSRPGHATISPHEEIDRVVPLIRALADAIPGTVLSIDTTSPTVGAAALDAGAHLLNDVWGVSDDPGMIRLAADRRVPIVLMHNRAEARYRNVVADVIVDLHRALERALDAGAPPDGLIIDPGFGFGKTPDHNLEILARLAELRVLGRPILLGTSRKSTLGKLLDLPADQRVEATAATTALAVGAGADIVRVHDVRENARTARVADAILRGWRPDGWPAGTGP
jgi:dihydropteroate synthase